MSAMTDRAHQRFNVEAAMVHKWPTQPLQIVCRRFFVLRPMYVELGTDINAKPFSISIPLTCVGMRKALWMTKQVLERVRKTGRREIEKHLFSCR